MLLKVGRSTKTYEKTVTIKKRADKQQRSGEI